MRKAGDVLTALFKENFSPEFIENGKSAAGLFSSWQEIVTEAWSRTAVRDRKKYYNSRSEVPAAAVHSRIRELERGALLIEADHPGWIQILQTMQVELLKTVQHKYPELKIQSLGFRLSRQLSETREPVFMEAGQEKTKKEKYENEDFSAAIKKLEESLTKRNNL